MTERAILMASGMGTRMRPLTLTKPKPLIEVGNKPMIETVIEALICRGVCEITIVVGYLGDQFGYLTSKYPNIKIIKNNDYETINNISSIYYAADELRKGNTFICEADLFVKDKDMLKGMELNSSCYFGRFYTGHTDDWVFDRDANGRITRVGKGGDEGYMMTGFSYLQEKEAKRLADCIEARYNTSGFEDLFWDDVVNENLDTLELYVHEILPNDITEIDTVEELNEVNKSLA